MNVLSIHSSRWNSLREMLTVGIWGRCIERDQTSKPHKGNTVCSVVGFFFLPFSGACPLPCVVFALFMNDERPEEDLTVLKGPRVNETGCTLEHRDIVICCDSKWLLD